MPGPSSVDIEQRNAPMLQANMSEVSVADMPVPACSNIETGQPATEILQDVATSVIPQLPSP
jgi:hypothetical protein